MNFDEYYAKIWGPRWPSLKEALSRPFAPRPHSFSFSGKPYLLDPASELPVEALRLSPDDNALDLCAAPGGKALLILDRLGSAPRLTLNEFSFQRMERLKKVLREYLPPEFLEMIRLTREDGRLYGKSRRELFDKILADVPCSGERHLLHTPKELAKWTPARSKNLARRQYALLASAFTCLKKGGRLVYSTCSISPLENDGVVDKLLKRKKEAVLEEKKFVVGPIFFAVIVKR